MRHTTCTQMLAAAALVLAAGCTMKEQKTPALTGPSEFGTSITVSVSPDILPQDGGSQSVVTITARDPNNQPVPNLSVRTQIFVDGAAVDFGRLSAASLVTGSDGRATTVYTAPAAIPGAASAFTVVDIGVMPVGTNSDNGTMRFASLRVVPAGVIVPPDGLNPNFTVTPSTPLAGDTILFSACTDPTNPCAPANNPIVRYTWDFGDGASGSGRTASHAYVAQGNFNVTLTVEDAFGRSASATSQVKVGAATLPEAKFFFSPNPPQLNQPVHFNASESQGKDGHRIISYRWAFGEGTVQTTTGPFVDFTYTLPRTYVVSLTVTDDVRNQSTATQTITVTAPGPSSPLRRP